MGKINLNPKDELSVRLGQQFRSVREQKRVPLRALARAIGRSLNTIRTHEAGSVLLRVDDIFRAAACLGVRPASLIAVTPEDDR